MKGRIGFSHFRRVNYNPGVNDLRDAFARSMALICAENATGVDLIIPVCLSTEPNTDIANLEMSAILIQVKNRHSYFSLVAIERKLKLTKTEVTLSPDVPYVSLLMSLWPVHKRTSFSVKHIPSERRTHVIIEGLDHYAIFKKQDSKEDLPKLKETCEAICEHKSTIAQRYDKETNEYKLALELFPREYIE